MDPRPLTQREHAVLDALLAVEFEGVEDLRRQAAAVVVAGTCDCGCPSIDFYRGPYRGMEIRVNAAAPGPHDGLFLYTVEDPGRGAILGGIEWVGGVDENPEQLPPPDQLVIRPA
ncbi:hypothetical protein [Actinosynnema sp. NPDC023587]|uniref:hypothetical protein n=1 Tax=Actinosynnema sp. NPDC023587 TaxID=3154695 RepID=UPI0033C5DB66